MGGSVHVTADQRLAEHLMHGNLKHGIEVELFHHWQHILSDKGEDSKQSKEASDTTGSQTEMLVTV